MKPMARTNSMAIIFILFITLLISTYPTARTSGRNHPPSTQDAPSTPDLVKQACNITLYPKLCESSLKPYPKLENAMDIVKSSLTACYSLLRQGHTMALDVSPADPYPNHTAGITECKEHFEYFAYRLNLTMEAFPRGEFKNGRAWLSAASTYMKDCWSVVKNMDENDPNAIGVQVFVDVLATYTSNAMSLMLAYEAFGNETKSWKRVKTEREGFWEGVGAGGGDVELGIPSSLVRTDITVCKGGDCEYESIQKAVDASPDWSKGWRFVIGVRKGVYEETVRVGIEKRHLVIFGDGMHKTVIKGSLHVGQPGISTYDTATFAVFADHFMAQGLTIKNTAGPDAHQAVAFRSDSDQSIIEECEFISNQDTLYVRSLRQIYKRCRIQGNIDFIFGNAAAIFQNCTILVRPRLVTPEKGEENVITAQGRIDPAESTGFVFQNCSINGTEEYMKLYNSNPKVHKNFLGRPWKEFSRTVFIGCKMEALIAPQGWMPWKDDFALKTLYYGEFNNSGKGSDLGGRVKWSNRIPPDHVNVYSVKNFLQGDKWKLKPPPI
ncbi:putative pectinesterase/pectinesterase inhibitor 51 [Bidens hawaiensis]|uniref:putative pectinesterase/pectinesterase inhibitor 51 n=1 Tax=Bidens hawaiensis TaxID=980011 RepID=UPI0040494B78